MVAIGANAQNTITLKVDVAGLKDNKGQLMVSLFNNSTDYLKKAYKVEKLDLSSGNKTIEFMDLEPGEYAVAVIHDENMNGTLDFGDMGPIEKYGFSNNAPSLYGPAEYSETKMDLQEDKSISITVQ